MCSGQNGARKLSDGAAEAVAAGSETVASAVAPVSASSTTATGKPSQFWCTFDRIAEKGPVATAWAALPYRYELLLVAVAAAVRFYDIRFPNEGVFDETYFGNFTNYYHTGSFYFDIHPPMAKITFVWLGDLLGYNAAACEYRGISHVYAKDCNYYILRNIAGVH